jgi:hypothetical protein
MNNFTRTICGTVVAAAGLLHAQQGTLAGPVAGFVFDNAAQALRPIKGVPGASLLGDTIDFGFPVSAVYAAPRQDSAIVVGVDQSLHLFLLNNGAPSEVSLGGLSGMPSQVVFSPSGTAVALVSPGSARVLTGLPNAPTFAGAVKVEGLTIQIQMGAAYSLRYSTPLALSDDGQYVATVGSGFARLLSIHGQDRKLMSAESNAVVAFAAGGHDLAVVDSMIGVTLIRDAAGAAGSQLLAAPDDGLAGPAGVAFSQDGKALYVASGKAQSVAAFNLTGASRTAIPCGCTPSTLAPLGNVFRLTELASGPLWLFDGTATTPRTVFVPARVAE